MTCLITAFSRVRGTLTLTFFCLGWKIIKFVLVKFRDNLFTLSQIIIFASSLLTIETRWVLSFVPPQWQLVMFQHLIIIIQTYRAVPSLLWLDNNFKNSLRSKLFRASFLQETKFVEGKKRGRRGREGLTRAITLLETLVMQARYNIKCFFSLILSFGHKGKFWLNFPGLY